MPDNAYVCSHYESIVVSATDYYPFGWEMPGRSVNKAGYRFGFNGKENDRDEWGQQLVQDYGFRLYNPAIGKFLSVDPLAPEYPWYTPYQFAGNMPIRYIDLDGLEQYDTYREYFEALPAIYLTGAEIISTKALIQFSESLYTDYKGRSVTQLTESQKQVQFQTSALNTSAILIYEFASGTGPYKRNFDESHPITHSLKEAEFTEKALSIFLDGLISYIDDPNTNPSPSYLI